MFGVSGFCNPVLTNKVATKTGFSFQEMSSYIIQNTHSRATMSLDCMISLLYCNSNEYT